MSLILFGLMMIMAAFAVLNHSVGTYMLVAAIGVGFVLAMRKETMFSESWVYAPGFVLIFLGAVSSLMAWPILSDILCFAGLAWMGIVFIRADALLSKWLMRLWNKLALVVK